MRFALRNAASLAIMLFGAVALAHAAPVPEIDPSMAGANLVLVAGAIAIVRNRIKR
jgi:hypothetical protein